MHVQTSKLGRKGNGGITTRILSRVEEHEGRAWTFVQPTSAKGARRDHPNASEKSEGIDQDDLEVALK